MFSCAFAFMSLILSRMSTNIRRAPLEYTFVIIINSGVTQTIASASFQFTENR